MTIPDYLILLALKLWGITNKIGRTRVGQGSGRLGT